MPISDTKGRLVCRGSDDAALVQSRGYATGLAVIQSENLRHIFALQFPVGEYVCKGAVGARHDTADPLLLFRPFDYPFPQGGRLHEIGHELYLIDAGLEEKRFASKSMLQVKRCVPQRSCRTDPNPYNSFVVTFNSGAFATNALSADGGCPPEAAIVGAPFQLSDRADPRRAPPPDHPLALATPLPPQL